MHACARAIPAFFGVPIFDTRGPFMNRVPTKPTALSTAGRTAADHPTGLDRAVAATEFEFRLHE